MDVLRIVSQEIPVHERVAAIQEAYASVAGVAIVRDTDVPLNVDSSLHQLNGVTIARSHCSPCTVHRGAAEVVDGNDDLVVCIVAAGNLAVQSRTGEWIYCGSGDVYLGPNDLPSTRVYSSTSAFFDITVPRGLLPSTLQHSADTLEQRKLAVSEVAELGLLADYIDLLTRGDRVFRRRYGMTPSDVRALGVQRRPSPDDWCLSSNAGLSPNSGPSPECTVP